jgi:hypothetical protein
VIIQEPLEEPMSLHSTTDSGSRNQQTFCATGVMYRCEAERSNDQCPDEHQTRERETICAVVELIYQRSERSAKRPFSVTKKFLVSRSRSSWTDDSARG